jgi:hypothetical protein
VFLRHSDVGQQWDGFSTQVRNAKGVWVPTAKSHYGQCYPRPVMGDAYLHRGAPGHAEARVPFPGSWVRWTGGEIPPACA